MKRIILILIAVVFVGCEKPLTCDIILKNPYTEESMYDGVIAYKIFNADHMNKAIETGDIKPQQMQPISIKLNSKYDDLYLQYHPKYEYDGKFTYITHWECKAGTIYKTLYLK